MTSTDTLAVGVLHAAYSLGATVARPTCRSSASTTSCSRATRCPALTTLRMPTAEIVAEGVQLAIEFARDRPRRATAGRQGDRAVADRPPVDGAAALADRLRSRTPGDAASSRIARSRFMTSFPPRPK